MFYVASENLVPMLVALLIGFVTGLWIWKLARRRPAAPILGADDPMRRPYVEAQPNLTSPPEIMPMFVATDSVGPGMAGVPTVDSPPATEAPTGFGEGDDFQALKGVGPKLAQLLRDRGLTRYRDIAALGPGEIASLDESLGTFRGRLARDRIVEQAEFLAAGDRVGYEAAFGRL